MGGLRLDGRTAIVTGAGGNPSLGRAHAMLLAKLGANVVVNDIGARVETPGYADTASAEAVAAEIRALGGKAVADEHSVAGVESAQAIIQTALDAFGRVDILVNNAAFSITAAFDELTPADFQRHIDVNLMGSVWTCRAAWPHMKAQRYGRIVNTASSGLAGAGGLSAYGASKGGIFSLSRQLASEGEDFGIKVNTINPGGFSRLVMATQRADSEMYKWTKDNFRAELASPVVAFLAHEACPVSGECIEGFAGTVRRMYLATTQGFVDQELTIDTVAARWDEVVGGADPAIVGYMKDEILSAARPYDAVARAKV
jgi:NAD(P)-dependent dehydrogenase (short-subunit alcohol dehydrogenase family)